MLVGEKIRRYNAQGTELTTPALARLTLQTDEKGRSTLTITDQDGRAADSADQHPAGPASHRKRAAL